MAAGIRQSAGVYVAIIRTRSSGPAKDVMYDDECPCAKAVCCLLERPWEILITSNWWTTLKPDSTVDEVIRNFFIDNQFYGRTEGRKKPT